MSAGQRTPGEAEVAGLSAGVIAAFISLFVSSGAYDIVNLIISVTLVVIIVGYVWNHDRRLIQSLAIAGAIALASLPGIGFIDEAVRSHAPLAYLAASYEWSCGADPCDPNGEHLSRVPNRDLAVGWLIVVLLVVAADRRRRPRATT